MHRRKTKPLTAEDKAFLKWISDQIIAAGTTRRAVALKAEIDPSRLTRNLNGERRMELFDFIRIAEALGKSPQDLCAGFGFKVPPKPEAQQVAERLAVAIPDDVWEILEKIKKASKK